MRAGKLDREITIEAYVPGEPDEYGDVNLTWQAVATMRAQIVQQSTEEFVRNLTVDETVIIFRTRWLDGVTNANRIVYGGVNHNIKEVKEIGRRKGLELRCIAYGGDQ